MVIYPFSGIFSSTRQRKNFFFEYPCPSLSISFRLSSNSNSPYFESKVPFCNDRSLNVNRGPSSANPQRFSFLKIELMRQIELIFKRNLPKLISMLSEKYIVSLIMKRNHLSPSEIWILWKYSCKHPPNFTSKSRFKIVKNQLRPVIGRISTFEVHSIRLFLTRSFESFKNAIFKCYGFLYFS